MYTKAFYPKGHILFQVSLKAHCLKWKVSFAYNKSNTFNIVFVICSLFLRREKNRLKS